MTSERTAPAIFDELQAACTSDGFIHCLSSIILRDAYRIVDTQEEEPSAKLGETREPRSRLNNNEIMLLVGLLVQTETPNPFGAESDTDAKVQRIDELMEELHQALERPMKDALRKSASGATLDVNFGDTAKEAIYYGAETAYDFQYANFARQRYRFDGDWFLSTKGISIRPIVEIAEYLAQTTQHQATIIANLGRAPTPEEKSQALVVEKSLLIKKFGKKTEAFFALFGLPPTKQNRSFVNAFSFNEATAKPLLDFENCVYVVNPYKLLEAIYDSPYFWMLRSKSYADQASINRGKFLEDAAARLLEKIFGGENVFRNVLIRRSKHQIAAEADVLVVYGEFAFVIQAKSKRLTLQSRSGDEQKIRSDFKAAVQSAYAQSIKFADLLIDGAECEVGSKKITFDFISRIFPIVVLSDHFPSLSILVHDLLNIDRDRFPVVIDIFFLEILCLVLNDPIELIYYFQQRSRFFDKVHSDSEYNILGFHLRNKLYVSSDCDGIVLDREFAGNVDDVVFAIRQGAVSPAKSLIERIGNVKLKNVLEHLKLGPPKLAGIAIEFLDFSPDGISEIFKQFDTVRAEVLAGKHMKSASLATSFGGISYVVTDRLDREARNAALDIAKMHKYLSKKDRWYVILSHVKSTSPIDSALPIWETWSQSAEMDEFCAKLGVKAKSTFVKFTE